VTLNFRNGTLSLTTTSLTLTGYAVLAVLLACITQLGQLDSRVFIALNQFAGDHASDEVLEAATMFGQGLWLMALISPLLLVAPRVNAAALYGSPLLLLFTHLPKLLFHWPRPSTVLAQHGAHILGAPITMNTFPSGHAIVAVMTGTVVILGWDVIKQRLWLQLLVLALVTLIGWSRVAVGAHWPVDVLAGAALGVLAGYAGNALAARYYSHSVRAWVTLAAIYGVCAIVLAAIPTHHVLQDLLRDILAATGIVSAIRVLLRVQTVETARPAAAPAHESLDREAAT
jgi:membrane-associated phospholipid phosphatase